MSVDAVKFVEGSDSLIEGLAVPFGGPFAGKDFDGEDFGADTDLALEWFPAGRPLMYDHGTNANLKTTVQGRQVEHELTDEGIWAKAELDKSAKYHSTVARLVNQGKLFFSSGSIAHLVETDAVGHIKRWPWVELSLTPTPANPFAIVRAAKSVERLTAAGLAVPPELIAAALKALDAEPEELIDRIEASAEAIKSGRVLSSATRDRLTAHPAALRQLADDLDELLANADAPKEAKSADLWGEAIQAERTFARYLGVNVGERIQ